MNTGQFSSSVTNNEFPANPTWVRMGIGISIVGFYLTALVRGVAGAEARDLQVLEIVAGTLCSLALVGLWSRPRLAGQAVLAIMWLELTLLQYHEARVEMSALLVYPFWNVALALLQGRRWSAIGALATSLSIPLSILAGRQAQGLPISFSSIGAPLLLAEVYLACSWVFARITVQVCHERFRDSERQRLRYTRLFQDVPDGLLAIAPDGRVAEANRAAERLLSSSRQQLVGHLFEQVLVRTAVEPKISPQDLRPGQSVLVQAGGQRLELSTGTSPDEAGTALLVVRDVTLQHKLTERQARTQRLEVVGQLAAGIAHEFNNLLTGIGGNAGLLKVHADRDVQRFAGQILVAQERAVTLTRHMQAFARHDLHQPEVISLGRELVEWRESLQQLLGSHCRLEYKGEGKAWVLVDRLQVEQILRHLLKNAREASLPGSVVELRLSRQQRSAAEALGSPLDAGSQVLIEVVDFGRGMTAEVKARLFEPFFTTKPVGQGTGLSLAAVHGLVTQNGGAIEVESTVKQGTAVRLFFPEESAKTAPPPARRSRARSRACAMCCWWMMMPRPAGP